MTLTATASVTFSRVWHQLAPTTYPSDRWGAGMAYDALRQRTVLFGGEHYDTALAAYVKYGDTWQWSGSAWTQLSPATAPRARRSTAMVYDAARGVVVMFGGISATNGALDDTWTWDGTNWTKQNPPTRPPARWDAMMAYDAARGVVVLFGGSSYRGDTWTWNGTTWTQQSPTVAPPVATAR